MDFAGAAASGLTHVVAVASFAAVAAFDVDAASKAAAVGAAIVTLVAVATASVAVAFEADAVLVPIDAD